jgi:3-hydroxybutyrate dehydrogenase
MADSAKQRLQGKVAVVTGAGRNIGRAEALLLAQQGAKVVVNDLGGGAYGTEAGQASIAEAVVQEIRDAGGEAVSETSSVASFEGGTAVVQKAIDAFGRIDILVNNAGIVRPARVDRMTDQDWNLCLDVSLKASFATTRAAAPHMIAQRSGVIVNTGSPSGFGHWGMANYSAAKEGLLGMTRTVARELGEFGVTANAICPGYVWTPLVEQQIEDQAKAHGISRDRVIKEVLLAKQPTRKFAEASEIGALAVFLAGDAAQSVTGTALPVDGGWTAQ